MHVFTHRYLQIGLGLLVVSAILRSASGSIASTLAEAVSTGIAAEQRAIGTVLDVLNFVTDVTTPAGAAFIAGALVIEGQRRASRRADDHH